MSKSPKISPPRSCGYIYEPLLRFVNQPSTAENWRGRLREAWLWESLLDLDNDEEIERELMNDSTPAPKIGGLDATYERAEQLRGSLRARLSELVTLGLDRGRLSTQSEELERGRARAWIPRKASVLPTGQIDFEDVGEKLNFLADGLEYEILWRVRAGALAHTGRQQRWLADQRFFRSLGSIRERERRWLLAQLRLSLCACGCEEFFLWEGDWNRKQRRFLDDRHRMRFHNRRNIERKRLLARERRKQGDPSYFWERK